MENTLCKTEAQNQTSPISIRRPQYRVKALEGAYEVQVQVPGCTREGIQVSLEKDLLTIKAGRSKLAGSDWKVRHQEFRESDFELKLSLNVEIDAENISARTEEGVLNITLPVAEAVKPKQIQVE
jgi:HSP20 family protein